MNKEKKKWSKKRKILTIICSLFVIGLGSFLFLFYGPWDGFRNFWITSAMTTMKHRYLAEWFYSDKTINEVLKANSIIEVDEVTYINISHGKELDNKYNIKDKVLFTYNNKLISIYELKGKKLKVWKNFI